MGRTCDFIGKDGVENFPLLNLLLAPHGEIWWGRSMGAGSSAELESVCLFNLEAPRGAFDKEPPVKWGMRQALVPAAPVLTAWHNLEGPAKKI